MNDDVGCLLSNFMKYCVIQSFSPDAASAIKDLKVFVDATEVVINK